LFDQDQGDDEQHHQEQVFLREWKCAFGGRLWDRNLENRDSRKNITCCHVLTLTVQFLSFILVEVFGGFSLDTRDGREGVLQSFLFTRCFQVSLLFRQEIVNPHLQTDPWLHS
jgi:hypothetical protein